MRIAVFIKSTTFHKGHGGLETQNKVLCEGLVKKGHIVTVFSPKRDLITSGEVENGVTYVFIPCSYRYLFAKLNKNSWFNKSFEVFEDLHNKEPYNLVLGQSSAAIGIINNKKALNVKVISISHGTALGEFKTQLLNANGVTSLVDLTKNLQYALRQYFGKQREFVLGSDKIVAVSNAVKKAIMAETFVAENKVTVINNGMNAHNSHEAGTPTKKIFSGRTVLFVGQLTKDKGIDFLTDIFINQSENFKLLIVGGGPLYDELSRKIVTNKAEDRMKLLGKIPYEEVIKLYKTPEIALMAFPTNRVEGFPMVLIEAMFAGLPVVAFDLGGVSDAVTNDVTGYLINPGDKGQFKSKLFGLLSDENKLEVFANNALKKAETEFSLDVMINKYEQVFNEVLN